MSPSISACKGSGGGGFAAGGEGLAAGGGAAVVVGCWPFGKKRNDGMSTQPSDRQIRKCVASPATAGVTGRHVARASQSVQAITPHPAWCSAALAKVLAAACSPWAWRFGPMACRLSCRRPCSQAGAPSASSPGRRPMRQGWLQRMIGRSLAAIDDGGGPRRHGFIFAKEHRIAHGLVRSIGLEAEHPVSRLRTGGLL